MDSPLKVPEIKGNKRQISKNKYKSALRTDSAKLYNLRQEILDSGQSPLEYMAAIYRDPAQPERRRDDMAKAAAPYLHGKPAQEQINTHQGPDGKPLAIGIDPLVAKLFKL